MRLTVKQLICDSLNGVRTTWMIHAVALLTTDRDQSQLVGMVTGSWSIWTGKKSRVRTAVDVGRGHEGMVGWKFAVGNAF